MASSCCLIETHRLICSMTYLGHYVTLTWGQVISFKVSLREKHDDVIADSLILLVQKLFVKNISPVTAILTMQVFSHTSYLTSGGLTVDLRSLLMKNLVFIKRRVQKLSICISCVLLFSYHSSWHNVTFSEKNIIMYTYQTLTFDDLSWPQYCSERKNDPNTFKRT